MSDLTAVEARIWSLLEPYRAQLEEATIYGMPSLRWPEAKAHDYFAAIKPAAKHVGLYLRPVESHPEALAGASEALLRRQTGKVTFTFATSTPRWPPISPHCWIGCGSATAQITPADEIRADGPSNL